MAGYVYAGGEGLDKVRKILKTDMTTVLDSADYGDIYALAEDANYVYAAGWTLDKVRKILKADMTTVLDSASYGGVIYALAEDDVGGHSAAPEGGSVAARLVAAGVI